MSASWSRYFFIALSTYALLTISLEVSAGYKEDYQNAVKRIQQGQFQQGLDLLDRIPEIEQQELRVLAVGNGKSVVYLPKYYKGLAAFNLGKCELAERNFISSLAQQVIKKIKAKHDKLKQMREVCRSRLIDGQYVNKLEKLTQTASDKALQLARSRNALNKLKKDPLLSSSWSRGSYFQTRLNETNQKASLAKREIDKIRLMPYSTKNRDYIVRLNTKLTTQIKNADRHVEDISSYRNSIRVLKVAFQKTDKSFDKLAAIKADDALSEDWKDAGKLNQRLIKLADEKQNLASQSKTIFTISNQEELSSAIVTSKVITRKTTEVNQQLSSLIDSAKNKIAAVGSILEKEKKVIYQGVNAFFSGSYGKSIMLLSQAEVQQEKSRYFQNLFIAAAYFSDPELKESEAIERARPYVKKAKSIQSKEDFDEGFFSPKFIKFFREVNE